MKGTYFEIRKESAFVHRISGFVKERYLRGDSPRRGYEHFEGGRQEGLLFRSSPSSAEILHSKDLPAVEGHLEALLLAAARHGPAISQK